MLACSTKKAVLHVKAGTAVACLSHRNSVLRQSVHPPVCPSHEWISQKWWPNHQIFIIDCPENSSFRIRKAFPEIRKSYSQRGH